MEPGSKWRTAGIHAIVWICFITYEVTVAVYMDSKAGVTEFSAFYLIDILLFYFNSDVVFRYAKGPRKIALILIPMILMELAIFSILSLVLAYIFYTQQTHRNYSDTVKDDTVRAVWRCVYIIGLSTGYWFFKRTITVTRQANEFKILQLEAERSKAETELSKSEIEKDLAVSQNAYLKSQINPHFLFNTLNYIYNSVEKAAPAASESILLLSDIMRYALSESEEDGKVPLLDETAHIERYISLTQLRFSNELFLDSTVYIDEESRPCRIPPLILLTFVENMFKHGDMTDAAHPARIELVCKNRQLHLFIKNKKRVRHAAMSGQTGITNADRRLGHHYPKSDFSLSFNDTLSNYSVDLRIRL